MPRVIVVGAGIIGLCCAHELRRRGATVTLLDRAEPGAACSRGNSGWVVPSLSAPLPAPGLLRSSLGWLLTRDGAFRIQPRLDPALARWLVEFARHCNAASYRAGVNAFHDLNRDTMALFDGLRADGVEFEMHRTGLLLVFKTSAGLHDAEREIEGMAARCGYRPPQKLTADDVREFEPGVRGRIAGGLFVGEERHVRPETLTAGLVKRLRSAGVEIHSGRPVTAIQAGGGRVDVITAGGRRFEADALVIAAGVWSARLARLLGCALPIQAGAGYSITMHEPPVRVRHALYLCEAKLACSPFSDALRLAGNLDLVPVDAPPDRRRIAAVGRAASEYLGEWVRAPVDDGWTGMRPLAPDGLPVIGPAPGFGNVYVATGHGMLGVTLAPATAAIIAQWICTERPAVGAEAFSPGRFSARRDDAA